MVCCSLVPLSFPLWVTLLAPSAPTRATPEPSELTALEADDAPEDGAPEGGAPEDGAPEADGTPEDGAPAADASETWTADGPADAPAGPAVVSPLDAPPPRVTATLPPTPIPPPPPRPIRWRADVGLGLGSTMVFKDRGFLAFSNDRNLLAVDVSTVLDFRLAEGRFFVGGGVAYQLARSGFGAFDSAIYDTVVIHEPRVLGRASFMMVEGLDVFARAGVGPSIALLDLDSSYYDFDDDSGGYHYATQRTVLPRVDGQAGLSLYLPKQWLRRKQAARVTAGVELSLGYTWRGTFDVRPKLQREGDVLDTTTPRLGELSLHGLAWGLGLFVRVM